MKVNKTLVFQCTPHISKCWLVQSSLEASLPVSIVLPIDIGIFPDLWLLYGSRLQTGIQLCTQMPDFHNNLFFITVLTLIASILLGPQLLLLLQPDFLIHSYHYHQYFWNKYRFVSPSSNNLIKMNLKHMHKGYYPACQCWSNAPVTPNMHPIIGLCQLRMTLRFFGYWFELLIWDLSYCFYKSALKMTKKL